jgi:DNA-directed RNA polymerase specialized sigma24 family protein
MLTEIEGYLKRNGFREDSLQEGLIAAWETQQKHPDQKIGYYARAAKNGAKSHLMGKKTTGRNAQGKNHLATSQVTHDGVIEVEADFDIDSVLDVQRVMDQLSDSHYEYVRLRFFEGLTHEESAKRAGIAYTTWSYTIRPRLRELLGEDYI